MPDIIRTYESGGTRFTEFADRVVDNDEHRTVFITVLAEALGKDGEVVSSHTYKRSERLSKARCSGGPLHGQLLTEPQAIEYGYVAYNRSSRYDKKRHRLSEAPSTVFVHESHL